MFFFLSFLFLDCPACILLIVFTNLLGLRPSWRVVTARLKRRYNSCMWVCVCVLLALYFENVRNAKRFLFFPNFCLFLFSFAIFVDVFFFVLCHFCAFFIIITIFVVVVVVTFAASDIFAGAFNSLANKTNKCK